MITSSAPTGAISPSATRMLRRDLDRGLVRGDLDERIVFVHLLTLDHQPAGDLTFREAFAEIRKLESVCH